MFQTISAPGDRLVQEPGIAALHRNYPYLRLFFGRFLADVAVRTEAGRTVVEWLIPDGEADPPGPERIRRELEAFYHALARAHGELHGGPPAQGPTRRTLASLVLGKFRVPLASEDVRFTRSGDMVVINWCLDRPGGDADQRRLEQLRDPREAVLRLAKALGVDAPPLRPAPTGRHRRAVHPAAQAAAPRAAPAPAMPQPAKGFRWYALALACGLGLAAGAILGLAAKGRVGRRPPRTTPGYRTGQVDLGRQIDWNVRPRAWVCRGRGGGPAAAVTVWLPLRAGTVTATDPRQKGRAAGFADGGLGLGPTRLWLVYEADCRNGFGTVRFHTPVGLRELQPAQLELLGPAGRRIAFRAGAGTMELPLEAARLW